MGRFFVHLSVFPFISSSLRPPLGHLARPEAQPARPEAQPARHEAQPARCESRWTEGRRNKRTDRRKISLGLEFRRHTTVSVEAEVPVLPTQIREVYDIQTGVESQQQHYQGDYV